MKRRRNPRRLGFLLLPVLPWVLIMVMTPWGRGLFTDLQDSATGLFAGAAPAASSAPAGPHDSASAVPLKPAPTGPRLTLDREAGPASSPVTLTGTGFLPDEQVTVYAGTRRLTTRAAGKDGTLTYAFTPRAEKLTAAGPLKLEMTAGKGARTATTTYTIP